MGGDCSAEGGTREGRVRGTLGPIGFIARLAFWANGSVGKKKGPPNNTINMWCPVPAC